MARDVTRRREPRMPRIEDVLADIAYFRRCIHEAGPADYPTRRDVHDAYAPFLDRRLQLLAMLTGRSAEQSLDTPQG